MHANVQGRLADAVFQETADDAVRLIVAAQQRAGATMFTDGEQRRDSYASFVGNRLDNCQLVPLTDLLPLGEGTPFRTLTYPAARGSASFYDHDHALIRSQEEILYDSAYPIADVEPADFWGGRPAL